MIIMLIIIALMLFFIDMNLSAIYDILDRLIVRGEEHKDNE